MADSKLVSYEFYGHKHWNNRQGNKIDKIVIHHAASVISVEQLGQVFSSRNSSATYGIGSDGRVGQYVPEQYRPWTTSSWTIDKRAITIEVSNCETGGDWKVSDKVLEVLIKLVADICRRNGIKKCSYTGTKNGVLQMHKWYANTACPGPYLGSKFSYISEEVNKLLKADNGKEDDVQMVLKNGLQIITFQGATLKVFKGYDDFKQLHMLSAVVKDATKAVQDISKFDSNNMIILAMANCNYFEMSNKAEYGQHYGVEQSEGDGVHSVGLDLAPKNKAYEVFYQLNDGTCGRCTSDEYWFAKKDVLFACTPYSTIVFNGKACNYKSSAFGNKDSLKNSQTMYMRVGGAWCIAATETKVVPSVMQSFALECGATEAFIVDSGGSTQLLATSTGKDWTKQIYTGRAIPNVLVLAKIKGETNTPIEPTPEPTEEIVSKAEYDKLQAELNAVKEELRGVSEEYNVVKAELERANKKLNDIKKIIEE